MAELLVVTPLDYPELASFLAGFYPESESQSFWLNNFHFWWEDNPAFSNDLERGWLLREEGRIVGFLGSIPTCFQLGGQTMTVFNSTTWRVLPEARHQSMNLLSRLLSAARQSILFNTTPNKEVVQILKALKFQFIPGLIEGRQSLVIINFENVLHSKLGKQLLAKILAPAVNLVQGMRLRKLAVTGAIRTKQITEADASFDHLWLRTKDLYPTTNLRTAEIVNWHCFKNEALKKIVFGCYKNEQLVGYAVLGFKSSKRHTLKILECLDLWLDPAESGQVASLVRAASQFASTHGIDLVSFPHFNPHLDSCLSKLGLFQLKAERNEYLKANPRLAALLTPESAYFVGLQGDVGLA